MGFKVAVVGATGNVGREMLNILDERRFPADEVVAVASRKSQGAEVSFGDRTLKCRALEHADFSDVDRIVVRYDNAFALMQDLRRMGATNVLVERRGVPLRRATLLRMAQIYSERFADADGRIRATFDIVWLLGWAPDASQPKPLRPGSAKFSLEDAVKKAGEKK
jgi:hypothetical protein